MTDINPSHIRKIIIEQSKRANKGHIGSALSIADILAVLYGEAIRIDNPNSPDRDRFILSKGHAVLALYAVLYLQNRIDETQLSTFCGNASLLGVHPEHILTGIDFSTGSLGQGLSFGVGSALAARLQESERHTYVLVSDAECNEGALWESVMFAAHHRLNNLTVIVDNNKQQALGFTEEVLSMAPMGERWRVFGWDAMEVDGHNYQALSKAISAPTGSAPRVIIANTIFGYGVSYMENTIKWHYWAMSDEEYEQALQDIGNVV